MELHQLGNIYVRNAVAVSQQESIALNVRLNFFDATASQRAVAGIDNGNFPVFGEIVVNLSANFAAKIERHVAVMERVVREIFFDNVLLVAGANYKFVEAVVRVFLHYVPENRLAANFNHRFRHELRFFADSRP